MTTSGAPSEPAAPEPAAADGVATPAAVAGESWGEAMPADDRRPEEILQVNVAGFEGPLDLLLALARTQKVDITRVSVLMLAEQYLQFIAEAQKIRLELAADYLVMAAWLAFLKSRLLLPKEEKTAETASAEEMAAHLAFRLQRLDAMRNAAAQLFTRKRLGVEIFARGMPEGVKTIRERQYSAEIFDLLKAYAEQRKRTGIKRAHVVKRRVVWSIKDARLRLQNLVGASGVEQWVQLDFFLEQYLPAPELGKTALASSFGATLEMTRDGLIEIQQAAPFAPIYMRKRGGGTEWERLA